MILNRKKREKKKYASRCMAFPAMPQALISLSSFVFLANVVAIFNVIFFGQTERRLCTF